MPISHLPHRGVVEITGEDRVAFLQGLVSNDVAEAAPGRAVWAALLTPQGKWLADFFVFATDDALLLDAEAAAVPMLVQKLSRFRLRSKVALRDASADHAVVVGWDAAFSAGVAPELPAGAAQTLPAGAAQTLPAGAAPDPRLAQAGWRALLPPGASPDTNPDASEAYTAHRLALGLPDGSADMRADQSILLEAGFDELHGLSWSKGCYMGQELTARTKYRGLIKRRLLPVRVEGALPAPGTVVLRDGVEVGEMRSGQAGRGMALLKLSALSGTLSCGDARLVPEPAAWMKLPEDVKSGE